MRGALRTAGPVGTRAWCDETLALEPRVTDAGVCQAVAEHYARTGLMEHASVGSFARFVLQLIAVGAPPELVLEAQQAIADEVRHARECFAIARAYGGYEIGPGPLAIEGALSGRHDLLSVTRTAIREGCVGETLAAVEVEEAASWARDGQLASTLARIAEDELAHARLSWRFVAWALRRVDDSDRKQLARSLWQAVADARTADRAAQHHTLDPAALRAHGVLSPADRVASRRRTLDSMIEPTAAALLERGPGSVEAPLL